MEQEMSKCPYEIGNTISLQLDASYNHQTVDAKITKIFEPFTLSAVVVILLDSPDLGLKGHMALKLFDRRFATQLRLDEKVDTWTLDMERQYYQFILDGGASDFITRLNTDGKMVSEEADGWNAAQIEAYLHDLMRDFYGKEVEVYRSLEDLQGKTVPRLFACLTVPGVFRSQDSSINKYIDSPGILLQYIEGFLLPDITAYAPREAWQSICESAIQIVHDIGDRGLLNEDVKTRSFIVQRNLEGNFKLFMVDFALCNFRREYQDENEWRQWKAIQDEEGAVGFVMQRYLQGGFVYHRSALYKKLDEDFKTDG